MAAPLGRYAAQKSFQQFHLLMSARMIPIWKGVGYTSWSQRPLLVNVYAENIRIGALLITYKHDRFIYTSLALARLK